MKLHDLIKKQRKQLKRLKKELQLNKRREPKLVKEGVKKVLLESFSPAQTRFIMGKLHKSNKWGRSDIITGLVLKSFSQRAYKFIREKRLFPLPSISTLREWIRNFDCKPGIQESALQGKIVKHV